MCIPQFLERAERRECARMYTAVVLSEMSADLLKWIVRATADLEVSGFHFQTAQGTPLPHHMTVNLGGFDEKLNRPEMMQDFARAELEIAEIVYDHDLGVCAAPVLRAACRVVYGEEGGWEEIKTTNAVPHVTLCIKAGCKPVYSNKMLESPGPHTVRVKLDKTYRLEGEMEVCQ
jgi:hypothetical protein